jgi:hypothetical protein
MRLPNRTSPSVASTAYVEEMKSAFKLTGLKDFFVDFRRRAVAPKKVGGLIARVATDSNPILGIKLTRDALPEGERIRNANFFLRPEIVLLCSQGKNSGEATSPVQPPESPTD